MYLTKGVYSKCQMVSKTANINHFPTAFHIQNRTNFMDSLKTHAYTLTDTWGWRRGLVCNGARSNSWTKMKMTFGGCRHIDSCTVGVEQVNGASPGRHEGWPTALHSPATDRANSPPLLPPEVRGRWPGSRQRWHGGCATTRGELSQDER